MQIKKIVVPLHRKPTIRLRVAILGSGCRFFMCLSFCFNADKFAFRSIKFAGNVITEVDCFFDDEKANTYAIISFDSAIFAKNSTETILATLADNMRDWLDYRDVNDKRELIALIDELLEKYREEIADYYDADDWDDYIVTLLECREELRKRKVTPSQLAYFRIV